MSIYAFFFRLANQEGEGKGRVACLSRHVAVCVVFDQSVIFENDALQEKCILFFNASEEILFDRSSQANAEIGIIHFYHGRKGIEGKISFLVALKPSDSIFNSDRT